MKMNCKNKGNLNHSLVWPGRCWKINCCIKFNFRSGILKYLIYNCIITFNQVIDLSDINTPKITKKQLKRWFTGVTLENKDFFEFIHNYFLYKIGVDTMLYNAANKNCLMTLNIRKDIALTQRIKSLNAKNLIAQKYK